MWMSDRPRTQAALADSLAGLVSILPDSSAVVSFLRAFWQTMQREWTNIDVLRMEKFLLLTRRYLCATFEVLKRGGWAKEDIEVHVGVLAEVPCNVEDLRVPNGMRFHVIDIYVDELDRVGALEVEEGDETLESLLEPLKNLAKSSPTKPVRTKAKEALEDERLPGKERPEQEGVLRGTDEWEGIED
jgi:ribosomal RNA-processing protein 1